MNNATATLVPKNTWAIPENVIKMMDELREMAQGDKIISMSIVGECADGKMFNMSTRTDDRFKVAAEHMALAMKLLGFVSERE